MRGFKSSLYGVNRNADLSRKRGSQCYFKIFWDSHVKWKEQPVCLTSKKRIRWDIEKKLEWTRADMIHGWTFTRAIPVVTTTWAIEVEWIIDRDVAEEI